MSAPTLSLVDRDLASPQEKAARGLRIVSAAERRQTRLGKMVDARRTLRECGISSPWELLAALNNIDAAMANHFGGTLLERYRQMVNAVCCDIETDMNETA